MKKTVAILQIKRIYGSVGFFLKKILDSMSVLFRTDVKYMIFHVGSVQNRYGISCHLDEDIPRRRGVFYISGRLFTEMLWNLLLFHVGSIENRRGIEYNVSSI